MKYTYEIVTDEIPQNPRNEFDNMSTFYSVRNSHYMTGGKDDIEYSYRDYLDEAIAELRKDGAIIVEFSGNVGDQYAVIERSQLKKEYLDHGYTMRKALYWARQCAKGEIATWLAWCEGEVYGYVIEDENGKHIDSCYGYFGEDGRKCAEDEAKSLIEWHIENDKKQDHLINVSCAL